MGNPVLSVRELKKSYKKNFSLKPVHALKGVSFDIQPGKVTGFLGANGAGKTTSIKCILNLAFPDSGEILYFGKPGLTSEVKAKIGFLPERPYFYDYLTGYEFLRFYADISGTIKRVDRNEKINKLLKRVGLSHAGDRQLRSYSKGMLQRVGIAQALIHEPEFIILDEPQTGLDPDGRIEVREIILETARNGTAVFFSSHLLPDAEQICDDLVILKLGNLVYHGATEKLLNKVGACHQIIYSQDGKLQKKRVEGIDVLQRTIDQLRKDGNEIHEIENERLTLEDAFMEIGFDKEKSP